MIASARTNRRASTATYGRSLLDEYRAYYARFPARRPDELYDPLRDAQEQRWRKADWRAMQKRAKQDARMQDPIRGATTSEDTDMPE